MSEPLRLELAAPLASRFSGARLPQVDTSERERRDRRKRPPVMEQ
eukprot:COSAG02_NODE_38906_length_423_cov_0.956790_1_plen_44_part_01